MIKCWKSVGSYYKVIRVQSWQNDVILLHCSNLKSPKSILNVVRIGEGTDAIARLAVQEERRITRSQCDCMHV